MTRYDSTVESSSAKQRALAAQEIGHTATPPEDLPTAHQPIQAGLSAEAGDRAKRSKAAKKGAKKRAAAKKKTARKPSR